MVQLGDMGDWSTSKDTNNSNNRLGPKPVDRMPRKDMFKALFRAGTKRGKIDGLPTNDLWKLCKEKCRRSTNRKVEDKKKTAGPPALPATASLYPILNPCMQPQGSGQAPGQLQKWKRRKRDYRHHINLTIYWKNGSTTVACALIDTGAEAPLIYAKPPKFKQGTPITITGLGGTETAARQVIPDGTPSKAVNVQPIKDSLKKQVQILQKIQYALKKEALEGGDSASIAEILKIGTNLAKPVSL